MISLEQDCLHSPVHVAALVANKEVSPIFDVVVQITKLMVVMLQINEVAQYKAFATIQVRDNAKDGWYPDTGANQHMTSNPSEVQGIDSHSTGYYYGWKW